MGEGGINKSREGKAVGREEAKRGCARDKKGGFGGRLWIALKAVSFFRYTLNFSISSICACTSLSNFLVRACLVAEKRWGKRKEIRLLFRFWVNSCSIYVSFVLYSFYRQSNSNVGFDVVFCVYLGDFVKVSSVRGNNCL